MGTAWAEGLAPAFANGFLRQSQAVCGRVAYGCFPAATAGSRDCSGEQLAAESEIVTTWLLTENVDWMICSSDRDLLRKEEHQSTAQVDSQAGEEAGVSSELIL